MTIDMPFDFKWLHFLIYLAFNYQRGTKSIASSIGIECGKFMLLHGQTYIVHIFSIGYLRPHNRLWIIPIHFYYLFITVKYKN